MSDDIIIFEKVNKWYGDAFHVLRDIDLRVRAGERIVICGPSGSGKSTLIRCINRLEEHQEGRLVVDGVELAGDGNTMLCVTHEMGFAKAVADRVIFMDEGQIVEENTPHEFFNNPRSERSKDFLSKILGH